MSHINIAAGVDKTVVDALLASSFAGTVLAATPETDTHFAVGVLVSVDKQSFESICLPQADDHATDGSCCICSYSITGCTVFIRTDFHISGLYIHPPGTSIKTLLKGWDPAVLSLAKHWPATTRH